MSKKTIDKRLQQEQYLNHKDIRIRFDVVVTDINHRIREVFIEPPEMSSGRAVSLSLICDFAHRKSEPPETIVLAFSTVRR